MPTYATTDAEVALEEHLRSFFDGHEVTERRWDTGPIYQRVPTFKVWIAAPGPRINAWTFVSSGCWLVTEHGGHGIEFVLAANTAADLNVELLAVTSFYHAGPPSQRLDLGHTAPIGAPWADGSDCDHVLISLPYAYGPDLEVCAWEGGHARLLGLFPITGAEREFKAANGLEALEAKLDDAAADFTNPFRASVV